MGWKSLVPAGDGLRVLTAVVVQSILHQAGPGEDVGSPTSINACQKRKRKLSRWNQPPTGQFASPYGGDRRQRKTSAGKGEHAKMTGTPPERMRRRSIGPAWQS